MNDLEKAHRNNLILHIAIWVIFISAIGMGFYLIFKAYNR